MAASGRATWHADDIMTSAMTSSRGSGLANVSMTNVDVSVDRSTLTSQQSMGPRVMGPTCQPLCVTDRCDPAVEFPGRKKMGGSAMGSKWNWVGSGSPTSAGLGFS